MALALSVRTNQNTRERGFLGDLLLVIYNADLTVNYPAGGEAISFATEFREVFSVSEGAFEEIPGDGWNDLVYITKYVSGTVNTGFLRFYVGAVAAAQFAQEAAGAYGSDFRVRLLVTGRPITDAS